MIETEMKCLNKKYNPKLILWSRHADMGITVTFQSKEIYGKTKKREKSCQKKLRRKDCGKTEGIEVFFLCINMRKLETSQQGGE